MKKSRLKEIIREEIKFLFEKTAGEIAKEKGLKHVGWGRYAKPDGTVVAKSEDGKLVPVSGTTKDSKPRRPDGEFSSLLGAGKENFEGPTKDSDSIINDARKQRYVNRFMNKLNEKVKEAKETGKPLPNFNLCEISIPGTNLFCGDNLDIPRKEMPQLKGKPTLGSPADKLPKDSEGGVNAEDAFKKYLEKKGYKIESKSVDVLQLKASQRELVGAKVVGMREALQTKPPEDTKKITAPIFVSKDGYILDGHHRWAALVGLAMGTEKKKPPVMMDVQIIDIDAKNMIDITNDFTNKIGIQQKTASPEKGK